VSPANANWDGLRELESAPIELQLHRSVQHSLEIPESASVESLSLFGGTDTTYVIDPGTDINGAGLLYFARYIAFFDQAEASVLRTHATPISAHLSRFLVPSKRQLFFFANADVGDGLRVIGKLWMYRSVVDPLRLRFRADMYRAADMVLMASTLVEKRFEPPQESASLAAELRRFALRNARA
jgi:probable biosynthetic protein (TIGR04098 family)